MCKSDEEILQWLRRKYIVMNYNMMRFDLNEFSTETKIVSEAKLSWVPFSTVLREEHVYSVQLTEL